jgi:transposase
MKKGQNTRGYARYLACDIHREYILVGGQNEDQEWVLTPRRVSIAKFPEWARKNLRKGDIVILETTTNVWETYDIIAPLVSRVLVANASGMGEIVGARVTPALAGGARETDKEDIKRMLRVLIGGIVPEVWVPPMHVRELRAFISYRNRLVATGAMIRNRLQSLLHKHNLMLPEEGILDQGWWDAQRSISGLEKMQIRQELSLLEEIEKHKAAVDEELGRQFTSKRWGAQAVRLVQLPGVGVIIAMTVLSAIGDISRFESATSSRCSYGKKLVGYAGLGAGVHDSGKTHKEKKITKKGRKELRWATLAPHCVWCSAGVVEAAWRAVRMSPFWKAQYEKYLRRLRKKNQAIVVIARKLLVAIWHVLSKEETDEHASEEDLAYKMLLLSWSLNENVRKGLTYKQFAKYALMKLGVEKDITRFVRKNVPRRLAPRDEVLAHIKELGLA